MNRISIHSSGEQSGGTLSRIEFEIISTMDERAEKVRVVNPIITIKLEIHLGLIAKWKNVCIN